MQSPNGVWSMSGPPSVLVDASSATHCRPGEDQVFDIHPINRNHSELVKFSRKDVDYGVVLGVLQEFAQDAYPVIQARFKVNGEDKANGKRLMLERQLPYSTAILTIFLQESQVSSD